MRLTNRTILITGGTSGIGYGLVEAFYKSKCKVIACGRDKEKLASIEKEFPDISAFQCDVSDSHQRKHLATEVLQRFPEIDTLINNAGIQRYIDLKKGYTDLKSGENEITTNFTSVVELTSLFISHLLKRPSAAIINVSSGLAFMPMLNTPIYCATKAALHTYTLVLRQQLKDTSVKVIEIVPPMVDTNLNKKGRDLAQLKFRGVSLSEYIPSVIQGFEKDEEMIFFGDAKKVMTESRSESETRLFKPSW